jgi:gliding motility-associated-like protein
MTTTYTATVYGKCDSTIKTITVNIDPLPKPVIKGTPWKCKGVIDTLTVSGGTKYLWGNGSTKTTYYTGDINADSTITVTAYNSLGCSHDTSFSITVRTLTVSVGPHVLACSGESVLLTAAAAGTGPFTYSWSPGGATTDTVTVNPDTVTNYVINVSNGCKAFKTVTVTPDFPTLFACCDKAIIRGDDTIIYAIGDTNLKSLQWLPDSGFTCLDPPVCDTIKVAPLVTTTYTVIETDKLGCTTERVVTIIVEIQCFNFTVPNVFTPDFAGPNGLNSFLYIKTENLSAWSITIFDRWGKEMFKSTNPLNYWAGTTEGGSKASDGVYYYIISATCQGNTYKKDGFVQLIR